MSGELMWSRVRESLGGGVFVSAILVFLLTYAVAKSTATVDWVNGVGVITYIALAGAIALGLLAILPVPWPAALALGTVTGPVIALVASWPFIHALHPEQALDARLIGIWFGKIADGSAATDPTFFLFLICWLMWVTGAWLSWCVLRWRKPMLGLIPGAAAFATNLLNYPADQNGYTLAILVLTLSLLLWSNYTTSIANATRAHVKLTGDAKWDFWESGLVAMAALIVLGIMLPPMSTSDKTADVESGMFSSWAQLQQRLSHPGFVNSAPGGTGTTGFTTDVHLGTALQRTRDPVFSYTIVGDYAGPRYFRGVDVTVTANGEWRYAGTGFHEPVPKGQELVYGEQYSNPALAGFDVHMIRPPTGSSDILFYPSQFVKVDRATMASEVPLPPPMLNGTMLTLDRLSSLQPSTSAGNYDVTVEYSTATVAQLQAAGTGYPDWIQLYTSLPPDYRPPDVLAKIHDLALSILAGAGLNPATATVYDEASAIEQYLRSSRFSYTLTPPPTPPDTDQMDFFLFNSRKGYCEYFATAMGDLLRSLGIPTRLVNGFGPGQFDPAIQGYVVRGEDAHTWVEVYFPQYGWIPFEPTNDGTATYQVITRGATGALCLRDDNCTDPGGAQPTTGGTVPVITPHTGGRNDPAGGGATGGLQVSGVRVDASTLTKAVGVLVAIVLVLLAVALRYLRPRTVMAVWRRTLTLAGLAGAQRRPGETPLELGRRLQRLFPEAAEPVGTLAQGFVLAAYAPADLASTSRASVMEAWATLRPMLLRRAIGRLRPGRID